MGCFIKQVLKVLMSKNKLRIFSFTSIKYLIIFILLAYASYSHAISLIVNTTVTDTPSTSNTIRNIFTVQQTHWSDGNRIQVFVLADNNPIHQQFSKTITQIFPHLYRRIWDRLTFSGTGIAPTIVDSEEKMLTTISQTPYSIGYIQQSSLTPSLNKNIRLIKLSMLKEKQHE